MRLVFALLAGAMALAGSGVAAKDLSVYIDGRSSPSRCTIIDENGALYARADEYAAAVGLKLLWPPGSTTLIFSRGKDAAALKIGSVACDTGTGATELRAPVLQKGEVALLSIYAVEAMFGMEVSLFGNLLLVQGQEDSTLATDEVAVLTERYLGGSPAIKSAPNRAVSPASESSVLPLKWTGHGHKVTEPFTVNGQDWKLVWKNEFPVYLGVMLFDAASRSFVDLLVNSLKATSDTSYPNRPSGSYYLDINGIGAWSVVVEAVK